MAEVVADFPTRLHYRRHPWDKWLDGQIWKLESGVDFAGSPRSFVGTVHHAAKRMGVRAQTREADGHLYVQKLGTLEEPK
jgi:hypothetical protein